MDELLSDKAVDKLVMLFVAIAFMLLFWFLDSVWRNDKRWTLPIIILPPLLLVFIYNYWEETRAKCFFSALFAITIVFLGAVTGYSFSYKVGNILLHLALWPFYLTKMLYQYVA